jgi:cobalt-precorrin 5A hydrolase/precorrin-3B C17-methyltransferase
MTDTAPPLALVVFSESGLAVAQKIRAALPGATIHGFEKRVSACDETFADAAPHLRRLFQTGHGIVGICAAGILVRALAPCLADKWSEPPVLAVAQDGGVAVPLLGGHHGANRLARTLSQILGGVSGVTTAGDVRFDLALDEPPAGWRVANPLAAKDVAGRLLSGQAVALCVEAGDAAWIADCGAAFAADAPSRILVTDKTREGDSATLVMHPPVLAVGVGCNRGTAAAEVIELVDKTLADAGLAAGAVACLASIDAKMDEPALEEAAAHFGVPIRFFDAAELNAFEGRLTEKSEHAFAAVGCWGVAEGAAFAAAGSDAALVVPKAKSGNATCAVARAASNIDPALAGQARGSLTVVGVGPGTPLWRSPDATAALARADAVVGYKRYLNLVADVIAGKPQHVSGMTREEVRVTKALDLAAEGRNVCLVCSGDPGIYALASLTMEMLDKAEHRPDWRRIRVRIVPGITAAQGAAALAGAPMGHDFCLISLSDLLTDWQTIETRLKAAALGDFIVALYNPVSRKRRSQIERARDILLTGRPGTTPVVIARNVGRDDHSLTVTTLADLKPEDADMLSMVIIGNSATRAFDQGGRTWVYSPRGYAKKLSFLVKE